MILSARVSSLLALVMLLSLAGAYSTDAAAQAVRIQRVLLSTIDMTDDWTGWTESDPVEVLRSERPWEGADLQVEPSRGGSIDVPVHQLRDPAIFEEDGRVYLLDAVAGERGIGRAEVHLETLVQFPRSCSTGSASKDQA